MLTKHAEDRMRQRGLSEDVVGTILELGEWNGRGNRLELPQKVLGSLLQQKRSELKLLERLARRGGASVVMAGETLITVYSNTKRMRS